MTRLAGVRIFLSALLLAVACGASAIEMPRFDKLEKELKIRPEQKEQFEAAVGATQRALLAVAVTAMQFKDRLADELLKRRPDIWGFMDSQQEMIEKTRPLFREARDEWRRLYDMLDDEQVDIARAFVEKHLGGLLRQLLKEPRDTNEQI